MFLHQLLGGAVESLVREGGQRPHLQHRAFNSQSSQHVFTNIIGIILIPQNFLWKTDYFLKEIGKKIYETKVIYPHNLFCALKHIYKALSGRGYTIQQIIRFLSPLQRMCVHFCV